jgi:WD40 repeat protein
VHTLGGATFVVERGTNKVFNPTGWKYHSAKVQALGVNPSGTAVATASLDSNVILWNDYVEWSSDKRVKIEGVQRPAAPGVDWVLTRTASGANFGGVTRVDFIDEKTLVTAGEDRVIRLWKL